MHTRIVCIGNRLFEPDAAGPQVFDLLTEQELPADVELVDGGLGGLRLLSVLEKTDTVIFVDAVEGFRKTPGIILIDPLAADLPTGRYDHEAGLAYLLRAAPHILDDGLPEILLVGIEGSPTAEFCRQAAQTCSALVVAQPDPEQSTFSNTNSGACHG